MSSIAPIIDRRKISLNYLRGKVIAFDANNMLYQFLALIRMPNGSPLRDREGRVTSHLVGLAYRTTRIMLEYDIRPVFIFDGKPVTLKREELEKRREARDKASREWIEALRRGDYRTAFSKAVVSSRLTSSMINDAKKFLDLAGIPYIDAFADAEAQAAYMARKGDVWAVGSRDYDSILYGSPRLIRYITISGTDFLPSKGVIKPLTPELIELDTVLKNLNINRRQLIDIAILIGTDFNKGVYGIGPKKALKLIKIYGCIEKLPSNILEKIPKNFNEVRNIFLNPRVIKEYSIKYRNPRKEELYQFLVEERSFSREKAEKIIERLEKISFKLRQTSIDLWLNK